MRYFALLCVLVTAQASAGAWTQREDSGELLNTFRYHSALGRKQIEWNPYMEFGLSDALTLGTNLGLRRQSENGNSRVDLGYAEGFGRVRLAKGDYSVLSLQPSFGTAARGLSSARYATTEMAELRLLLGIGTEELSMGSFYFNFESAYRSFFNAVGAEWRNDLSAGWKFSPGWIFLAQYFGVKNLRRVFSPQDYNSHQLQGSLVFPLSDSLRGQVGVAKNVAGKNVDKRPTYLVSLWYSWAKE